jgi:hypothetical protein
MPITAVAGNSESYCPGCGNEHRPFYGGSLCAECLKELNGKIGEKLNGFFRPMHSQENNRTNKEMLDDYLRRKGENHTYGRADYRPIDTSAPEAEPINIPNG